MEKKTPEEIAKDICRRRGVQYTIKIASPANEPLCWSIDMKFITEDSAIRCILEALNTQSPVPDSSEEGNKYKVSKGVKDYYVMDSSGFIIGWCEMKHHAYKFCSSLNELERLRKKNEEFKNEINSLNRTIITMSDEITNLRIAPPKQ